MTIHRLQTMLSNGAHVIALCSCGFPAPQQRGIDAALEQYQIHLDSLDERTNVVEVPC